MLIKCRACQFDVSKNTKKCPHCGEKLKSWKDNMVIIILLFILFFPIALYGLWTSKTFSNPTKLIVSVIFSIFLLIGLCSDTNDTNNNNVDAAAKSKTTAKKKVKPISNINYFQIRKYMENKTELQFDEYAKTLIGHRIKWHGWIENVDSKIFGGYVTYIDMDAPNSISIQDVSFDVSQKLALSLQKGKKITFTGDIETIDDILTSCQVTLTNVKIE